MVRHGASQGYVSRLVARLVLLGLQIPLMLVGLARWIAIRGAITSARTHLVVESGVRGWELIEYDEIYRSACEYLSETQVSKVIIEDRDDYVQAMRRALRATRPSHYFYDPRTGSQNAVLGLWQAFQAAVLFRWFGVTPIAWLTDLPVRAWRRQCSVVTAHSGVIVTLMAPPVVAKFLPHGRLSGPSLMAISRERLEVLQRGRSERTSDGTRAVFAGSMYEPRTTVLWNIRELLRADGWDLELQVRELDGQRVPNEEYWARLYRADILVTTADQVSGKGIDKIGLPHLIFRYSEALAAGALLVAPEVPGIHRYFVPGTHFVPYNTPVEAAEIIAYYLSHPEERKAMAAAGAERMSELIRSHVYWVVIDSTLGKWSMTH